MQKPITVLSIGAFAVAMLMAFPAEAGPTTQYWVTSPDRSQVLVVQGHSIVNTITTGTYPDFESAIAIGDTARTFGNFTNSYGREYQLNGAFTGNTYVQNTAAFTDVWDGTTDGVSNNFSVQQWTGKVIRYDREWKNPSVLLNLDISSSDGEWGGIAYDSSNDSLWINRRGPNPVFRNYSSSGALLRA